MKINNQTYRLIERGKFGNIALLTGIIGFILSFIGFFVDSKYFFFSYLNAYVFWITISLGALFFTMLHYLVNATWSIVLRRISESLLIVLPFMFVLFIPIILGINELYHWSDPDAVNHDPILQSKAPFLNINFFIIRTLIYFIIWGLLARLLYKNSIEQDKEFTMDRLLSIRRISAIGMVLFAFTLTFAAFDWLMSLDAHWYSTIFGVYIFSGSLLSVLAFFVLIAQYLRKNDILSNTITIEHYHDLGRLLFAFIIFWAYIAFSQYFLMWYANIPEETVWFLHRWEGYWKYYTLILIFGYFIFPFLILMLRAFKRNLLVLKGTAIWLLLMH